MKKLNRRKFVKTLAAAGAVLASDSVPSARGALTSRTPVGDSWDVVVIGAGVFGSWTALSLRRAGRKVLLVDQYGPANSRAS
ncbi:MAG TPA: FAD-dependent oxidoreductase, partial [Candidatus Acidoferrales bacterium]|nr:FAD-dependent oxidoreductase [Candidatus Acidoferrales bacterium]